MTAGDVAAFDAFYVRHRAWVLALALRFTGNQADAADVLQETFTYIASKAGSGRFELTAAATTLLYQVVRHTAIGLRQKHRREPTLGDLPFPELAAPDGDDPTAARQELAAVLRCLPETHREVLLLRFLDDFSLEEIGQALGIPLGTVKSRLHNALEMLRTDPRTRRYFESG